MKRLIVLAPALAACAALAVPALAATRSVKIGDNFFSPKAMTISKGTTVRWTWTGRAPHNVTVASGPQRFRSGNKTGKGSFTHRFTATGRYRIVCTIHPGMQQTIRVR
jgi:plastocyanin